MPGRPAWLRVSLMLSFCPRKSPRQDGGFEKGQEVLSLSMEKEGALKKPGGHENKHCHILWGTSVTMV